MSNLVTLKVKAVKEIDWGEFLLKNKIHVRGLGHFSSFALSESNSYQNK